MAKVTCLILLLLLSSCSLTVFEYEAMVNPVGVSEYAEAYTTYLLLTTPVGDITTPTPVTLPFIGDVNPLSVLTTILKASEAIKEAKEIELGTLGDPAAMSVLYSKTPVEVIQKKTILKLHLWGK